MPPTAGIVARPARENLLRALGRRYRRGAHAVKARIFVGGYRPEQEHQFEQQSLARLRRLAPALGVTGVVGTALSIGARSLLPDAQHTELRLMLLPMLLLMTIAIFTAQSVRGYGTAAAACAATLTFGALLGAQGMASPLMYFLPGLLIVVMATSFFWINFTQLAAGLLVCNLFLVPFAVQGLTRAEWIYGGVHVLLSIAGASVGHLMMQDYRRRAFIQARRLSAMSSTDELTGIHNRRHFLDMGCRIDARMRESLRPLSVLYLDIDHFKSLNDRYGHAAGDQALRSLARTVNQLIRAQDLVGRIGGEEFAVLLPDCPIDDAIESAERLRQALAQIARPDGWLTVSIGVAQRLESEDLSSTLHRADLAMLTAKQAGRNAVKVSPLAA